MPERSFFIRGRQFHICARCTGLFVGGVLSLPLLPLTLCIDGWLPALLLPMPIDGVTQLIGLRRSNNALRFFSGLLFGIVFLPSIAQLLFK